MATGGWAEPLVYDKHQPEVKRVIDVAERYLLHIRLQQKLIVEVIKATDIGPKPKHVYCSLKVGSNAFKTHGISIRDRTVAWNHTFGLYINPPESYFYDPEHARSDDQGGDHHPKGIISKIIHSTDSSSNHNCDLLFAIKRHHLLLPDDVVAEGRIRYEVLQPGKTLEGTVHMALHHHNHKKHNKVQPDDNTPVVEPKLHVNASLSRWLLDNFLFQVKVSIGYMHISFEIKDLEDTTVLFTGKYKSNLNYKFEDRAGRTAWHLTRHSYSIFSRSAYDVVLPGHSIPVGTIKYEGWGGSMVIHYADGDRATIDPSWDLGSETAIHNFHKVAYMVQQDLSGGKFAIEIAPTENIPLYLSACVFRIIMHYHRHHHGPGSSFGGGGFGGGGGGFGH